METQIERRKAGRPVGTIRQPIATRLANGLQAPAYQRWLGMKRRCFDRKSHIWKYYGGRGITVCARWLGRDGFRNFYEDMGEPNGLTLDRFPNNDGNYEPGNCRWATMKEQAENKRNGQRVDPKSLRQKAIAAGLPYTQIYFRIHRLGWTEKKALTTPILRSGRQVGTKFPGCGGRKRTVYDPAVVAS